MSQAAKVQEPSMEEILASIRRIISDDDPPKGQAAATPSASEPKPSISPAPVRSVPPPRREDPEPRLGAFDVTADIATDPEESSDVLELTETMEARREDSRPSFRTIEAGGDVVFSNEAGRPAAAAAAPLTRELEADLRPLMSHEATAAVTSAFGSLAHTVLSQNARTLEDLVREMLRPMLKSWLDDNLPTMVERMVRAEIERVSRGS